jgi:hypothetical protein
MRYGGAINYGSGFVSFNRLDITGNLDFNNATLVLEVDRVFLTYSGNYAIVKYTGSAINIPATNPISFTLLNCPEWVISSPVTLDQTNKIIKVGLRKVSLS